MKFYFQFYFFDGADYLSNNKGENFPYFFADPNFLDGILGDRPRRPRGCGGCLERPELGRQNALIVTSHMYDSYAQCKQDLLALLNEQALQLIEKSERPVALFAWEDPAFIHWYGHQGPFTTYQLFECKALWGDDLETEETDVIPGQIRRAANGNLRGIIECNNLTFDDQGYSYFGPWTANTQH